MKRIISLLFASLIFCGCQYTSSIMPNRHAKLEVVVDSVNSYFGQHIEKDKFTEMYLVEDTLFLEIQSKEAYNLFGIFDGVKEDDNIKKSVFKEIIADAYTTSKFDGKALIDEVMSENVHMGLKVIGINFSFDVIMTPEEVKRCIKTRVRSN